jgi:hypothetical protein
MCACQLCAYIHGSPTLDVRGNRVHTYIHTDPPPPPTPPPPSLPALDTRSSPTLLHASSHADVLEPMIGMVSCRLWLAWSLAVYNHLALFTLFHTLFNLLADSLHSLHLHCHSLCAHMCSFTHSLSSHSFVVNQSTDTPANQGGRATHNGSGPTSRSAFSLQIYSRFRSTLHVGVSTPTLLE